MFSTHTCDKKGEEDKNGDITLAKEREKNVKEGHQKTEMSKKTAMEWICILPISSFDCQFATYNDLQPTSFSSAALIWSRRGESRRRKPVLVPSWRTLNFPKKKKVWPPLWFEWVRYAMSKKKKKSELRMWKVSVWRAGRRRGGIWRLKRDVGVRNRLLSAARGWKVKEKQIFLYSNAARRPCVRFCADAFVWRVFVLVPSVRECWGGGYWLITRCSFLKTVAFIHPFRLAARGEMSNIRNKQPCHDKSWWGEQSRRGSKVGAGGVAWRK